MLREQMIRDHETVEYLQRKGAKQAGAHMHIPISQRLNNLGLHLLKFCETLVNRLLGLTYFLRVRRIGLSGVPIWKIF